MVGSHSIQQLAACLLAMSSVVSPLSTLTKSIDQQENVRPTLRRNGQRQLDLTDEYLVCQLMEAHIMYEEGWKAPLSGDKRETIQSCLTTPEQEVDGASGMVYTLPETVVEVIDAENMQTQQTILIEGGEAYRSPTSDDVIVVPINSEVVVLPDLSERRLIANNFGINTVLALRVTSLDASNTLNATTISSRLFGGDGATLVSVYRDCSWGALTFIPASGSGIINGVAEIFINQNTVGVTPQSIENAVTLAAQAQVPSFDFIDHVMYCMPVSMAGTWVAYGYVHWYRTVYNNEWCGYVSAAVHEIGHNLGLSHSRKGTVEYGDKQGMMGYSYRKAAAPYMCFNAHKHWILGWYQSRSFTIDLGKGAWHGAVVAFTDYDQAVPGEYVVVNVGNFYIQYNRAEKFNVGTMEKGNQLTIVSADNEDSASSVLAGIDQINNLYRDITLDGIAVTIEICGASEDSGKSIFVVSIYLDTQSSKCGQGTRTPTNPITVPPVTLPPPASLSARPTPRPSSRTPTRAPTPISTTISARPTNLITLPPVTLPPLAPPSGRPTPRPSSRAPTRIPTLMITLPPITLPPLAPPSARPTPRPSSRAPTRVPTPIPTTISVRPTLAAISQPQTHVPTYIPTAISVRPTPQPTSRPTFRSFTTQRTTSPTSVKTPTRRPTRRSPTRTPTTFVGTKEEIVCDDSRYGRFYANITSKYEPCVWLSARPEYMVIFCDAGHASGARDMCAETCGKCNDNCTENPKGGIVDENGAARDCAWLSLRTDKQDLLCVLGHPAYTTCPETCNVCDTKIVPATPSPAVAFTPPTNRLPTFPPTPSSAATTSDLERCDDDNEAKIYVDDTGKYEPCVWLAARSKQIAVLCVEGHKSNARGVCPETCGACSDNCTENQHDKFITDNGKLRDCLWLSLRNDQQDIYCRKGHDAYNACPETCGSCDGR